MLFPPLYRLPPRRILDRFLPAVVAILAALITSAALAQNPLPAPMTGQSALVEVPLTSLSSQNVTLLGRAALSIRPTEWKHAETENFVYHYFQTFVASPVAVEAEFNYRVIAKDLGKDTSHWERKAHIFIFDRPEDWKLFQTKGNLDPWTGGIHANNELFLLRDPSYKFKGWTIGHETAHLVVNRFFGSNVPLWLNEGYAEYIARVASASFFRARGYDSRPKTDNLTPASFIPLSELTEMLTYPADVLKVHAFYTESEKLVRFLSATDKTEFLQLLDALSKGSLFENALHNAYGGRFPSSHSLEEEFKRIATEPVVGMGISAGAP